MIKKLLFTGLVFLFLSSIVFANSQEYSFTASPDQFSAYDISSIDTSRELLGWRCSAQVANTLFQIGDCYCFDTRGSVGDTTGLGYGNLFACLENNPNLKITSPGASDSVTLDFRIKTFTTPSRTSEVSISNVGRHVTCDATSEYLKVYTFFTQNPFRIIRQTLRNSIDIPFSISSGSEIGCQVGFYDGWRLVGSSQSNTIPIFGDVFTLNSVFTAPAYPRAGDTLYCYGSPFYDLPPSHTVNHTIRFFRNDHEVGSSHVLQDNNPSNVTKIIGQYSGFVKDDVMHCAYTIEHFDETGGFVKNITTLSEPVTILNTRPVINEVVINVE
ncbi:MAG: hypothetical protein ACMXYK_03075 [Candidatus Woesearchaeota archaeon]